MTSQQLNTRTPSFVTTTERTDLNGAAPTTTPTQSPDDLEVTVRRAVEEAVNQAVTDLTRRPRWANYLFAAYIALLAVSVSVVIIQWVTGTA